MKTENTQKIVSHYVSNAWSYNNNSKGHSEYIYNIFLYYSTNLRVNLLHLEKKTIYSYNRQS